MERLIDAAFDVVGRLFSWVGDLSGRAALWCWDEVDDRRIRRGIASGERVYDPVTNSWPRK